jgi:hypothetical protein
MSQEFLRTCRAPRPRPASDGQDGVRLSESTQTPDLFAWWSC